MDLWLSAVPNSLSYSTCFIKLYSPLITGDTLLLPGSRFGFNPSIGAALCIVKAARFGLIPAPYKQVHVLDVVFVVL